MSDQSQGDGWWQASDGKWYPPADAAPPTLPPPAADTPAPAEPEPAGKPWWKRRWVMIVGAVLAVFIAIGIFAPDPDDDSEAAPATTEAQDVADTTAPTTAEDDSEATDGDGEPEPSTTEPAETTTTAATTTTTTTTTVAATTTTLPPVPDDVLAAYEAAGLPTINPATYATRLQVCDRYRDDANYREAFWDVYSDDEVDNELAHLEPICPDAVALIEIARPLPIIEDGVYLVPDEVAPGVYRVGRYWAMLDADQEIIDNDLVDDCLSIMVLTDEAVYVEISGQAIAVADLPVFDPFESDCTDGTFLVGSDIQPGQYRVLPEGSRDTTYWARLDNTLDIIDNDLQDGQSIVNIQPGDFAFTFSGTLEPIG